VADFETRLLELGVQLPAAPTPKGSYLPAILSPPLLWISGQLPVLDTGELLATGIAGDSVDVETARAAARQCAVNILGVVRATLSGLEQVERVLSLTGYVASAPGFSEQAAVLNGASDLMVDVFGELGRHTRATVGVASLPLSAPVEVSAIVLVRGKDK
jgi:enamine deaminase RidA (YjgF/YER057c/UK114 family)